jgi:hypothetical protein
MSLYNHRNHRAVRADAKPCTDGACRERSKRCPNDDVRFQYEHHMTADPVRRHYRRLVREHIGRRPTLVERNTLQAVAHILHRLDSPMTLDAEYKLRAAVRHLISTLPDKRKEQHAERERQWDAMWSKRFDFTREPQR